MTNQDERLLKQLRGHPSFLFFVLEGVDAGLLLYSQALRQSEFLLGGLDFPSGRLHIDVKNKKATCLPHNDCSAVWITEVTMRSMRQNTSWDQVLNIQNKALSRAPLGMVIPRPKNQNWASWQDKYRSLAQSWSVANRSIRPPVPVVVEGAPLETVWHTPEEGKGVLINPSGTYTILK